MSSNPNYPKPSLVLVTTILISSLIGLGICDQDAGKSSNLLLGSYDAHQTTSYGNGPLGLATKMTSGLMQDIDGSIEKSLNITTFSFGSELFESKDVSSITGQDAQGHEFGTTYQRKITLKNCEFPFAIIREDLSKLSEQSFSAEMTESKTYLLLPEVYSIDQINTFSAAFGDSSGVYIKTFKYDSDMNQSFKAMDLDLGLYFGSFPWADAFGAFTNKDIWDTILKGAEAKQNEPNEPEILVDNGWGEYDSAGGISCTRHNYIL